MENRKAHWENVFANKKPNEVSWTQDYPKSSMIFFETLNMPLDANIIDIGGGDSKLVDALIAKGYSNIWVLDISEFALERAKKRLGEKAESINWIVSDVLDFKPTTSFDFWHDRAAFHFLTEKESIDKYINLVGNSVNEQGYFLLGTFSQNGPLKCSGLEITQYSEISMQEAFCENFEAIKCFTEDHKTPFDTTQNFQFCGFKRK